MPGDVPPAPAPAEIAAALAQAALALAQLAKVLQSPHSSLYNPVSLSPLPAPAGQAIAPICQPGGPGAIPPGGVVTVTELMNEFLRSKARAGRSDRYLQALRNSLSKFQRGRAAWPVHTITAPVIEAWLSKSNWAPKTRAGYLGDLSTLFNWGVRRGYLASNPAAAVEVPTLRPAAGAGGLKIGIHTPEQVQIILNFARAYDLNVCRSLAVRYFAGIRSAECQRLTEDDIKPGFVDVPAAKSKTRARRLVPIAPNLAQWLALGGALPLRDVNNRMRYFTAALKKRFGIGWPPNAPRHSFCTYHLAAFEAANKTALYAGHTETILFANYRELATKSAGESFFAVIPGKTTS